MSGKLSLLMALVVIFISIVSGALEVQRVEASGTIYIKANGSIDPPDAPISTANNVTYTFTDNIYHFIVIERNNIIVDGAGYALEGPLNGTGVALSQRNNVTVKNTEIRAFDYGILVDTSLNITIIGNNITANNLYGICIRDASNTTVSGNSVTRNGLDIPDNGWGIGVFDSSDNSISGNIIVNNWYGIYLDESSNNSISRNKIGSNSRDGILIGRSPNNIVAENEVTNNSRGIWSASSSNNTISRNNITRNKEYGFVLAGSANNVLKDNVMGGNKYNFGVDGYDLLGFINDVDTSNVIDGKSIFYLVNGRNLIIDPQTYPNIGYVGVVNSTNIIIRHLNIEANMQGISFAYTNGSSIQNLTLTNNKIGIRFFRSSDNSVFENTVSKNSQHGIYTDFSSSNRIFGNNVAENNYNGIFLSSSSNNNTILGNNITANKYHGIELVSSNNNTITTNNITANNVCGMSISGSGNNVSGNDIRDNLGGIWLYESSDNVLRSNIMVNNKLNFGVWGDLPQHFVNDVDTSNTVDGKTVYYSVNRQGLVVPLQAGCVVLVNCTRITVEDLDLANNSACIVLAYTSDATIIRNKITNNARGVALICSSNNTISGNNITGNSWRGILLCSSSNYNLVQGNEITNNDCGISLEDSTNNSIFHNNFLSNTNDVYLPPHSDSLANAWDNGIEGNYWSNYTGVDLDHDGIGDTVHVIDANNTDHYPLMSVFSRFNTLYNYQINIVSNSSISHLDFSVVGPYQAMLTFNVTGDTGTQGFCRICIPKALINGSYVVKLNGEVINEPQVRQLPCSNGTYEYLYINYTHSEHTIEISGPTPIPEFPSFAIPSMIMLALLLTVTCLKKKRGKSSPTTSKTEMIKRAHKNLLSAR
jgi:parallel beta-helix repeat protein